MAVRSARIRTVFPAKFLGTVPVILNVALHLAVRYTFLIQQGRFPFQHPLALETSVHLKVRLVGEESLGLPRRSEREARQVRSAKKCNSVKVSEVGVCLCLLE